MMHAEQHQCILYTVTDGPLPIYSVHLSCEGKSPRMLRTIITERRCWFLLACEINYHCNFKVYKGERMYYDTLPDIIQIGEHQFAERCVIEMWLALMDNS